MSDAASFVMSLYPDTSNGMDIMLGYAALDESTLPISPKDLEDFRNKLALGNPVAQSPEVDVYPGNPDLMFVAHIYQNFPGLKENIQLMRGSSLNKFQASNPNFV